MKKILFVFGTRPEAIKVCPVVIEFRKNPIFEVIVCVTGQHRQMLDQVLKAFQIIPEYDLDIMKENQSLFEITTVILQKIKEKLVEIKPDLVLIHGDTTTSFATSLAAFYLNIKIGHIEAGLRTNNIHSPFPEEYNRKAISIVSDFNFAPTDQAKSNLIVEGIHASKIFVTGNTAIDALRYTVKSEYSNNIIEWVGKYKMILLTCHRRENLGMPMFRVFQAIKQIVAENQDIKVVYPVHPNPLIRKMAFEELSSLERIRLIEPLEVVEFHNVMKKSFLILTDSGGIQEEAPSLGKPVLVLRDVTERPEGVESGTLQIVGTEKLAIVSAVNRLLRDTVLYKQMSNAINPYGDGHASERIAKIVNDSIIAGEI